MPGVRGDGHPRSADRVTSLVQYVPGVCTRRRRQFFGMIFGFLLAHAYRRARTSRTRQDREGHR